MAGAMSSHLGFVNRVKEHNKSFTLAEFNFFSLTSREMVRYSVISHKRLRSFPRKF